MLENLQDESRLQQCLWVRTIWFALWINIFLCLQLSDTSQQSEDLKVRVSSELSRIEDLNNNTQSSKDNVTGQ